VLCRKRRCEGFLVVDYQIARLSFCLSWRCIETHPAEFTKLIGTSFMRMFLRSLLRLLTPRTLVANVSRPKSLSLRCWFAIEAAFQARILCMKSQAPSRKRASAFDHICRCGCDVRHDRKTSRLLMKGNGCRDPSDVCNEFAGLEAASRHGSLLIASTTPT